MSDMRTYLQTQKSTTHLYVDPQGRFTVAVIDSFGMYREETVRPDVIFFKTESTFLAIKVKKDHLDIEFFLDHLEDVPPVSKYLQTSAHRVAHIVPIDQPEDITPQLRKWMKESYELIIKKTPERRPK
ncbi:hypothetical protein FGG08_007427 [Glutinoglossum americanum]|uniref:DUF5655 domain-containing protein n=1 Tax=Glutinoglossum americanum TaxID=1670608 RepID=A0A9P8HTX8_9PEZI|nr:hypothetical protein FGG08_007427 [Glutinoglossum americanum]